VRLSGIGARGGDHRPDPQEIAETDTTETTDPVEVEITDQKEPAEQRLAEAEEQGVSSVGPSGLMPQRQPSDDPRRGVPPGGPNQIWFSPRST
jgi:hypothetical protein